MFGGTLDCHDLKVSDAILDSHKNQILAEPIQLLKTTQGVDCLEIPKKASFGIPLWFAFLGLGIGIGIQVLFPRLKKFVKSFKK